MMDIVEFAKDILGIDMVPWQEEQLRQAAAGKLSSSVVFRGKPKRILDEYHQFTKLGLEKWKAKKESK